MTRMKRNEKGHEEAVSKWRESMLKRYGSDEAISEYFKTIGAKGGRNGHTGGFASNHALASLAGAKGGRKSRRGDGKRNIELLKNNEDKIREMLERKCSIKQISQATGINEGFLYRKNKRGELYV